MTLFPVSKQSQAYIDGYKSGQADRRLGIRLTVSWFIESVPGYVQSYSLGYRDGWSKQK
jgi:hypothetical protein